MAEVTIRTLDNGPYVIGGAAELLDGADAPLDSGETIALCRCGHSENKPFCDGSHKAAEFSSEVRAD